MTAYCIDVFQQYPNLKPPIYIGSLKRSTNSKTSKLNVFKYIYRLTY